MPKKTSKKEKEMLDDYLVIVTRTERRDYHYRVKARNEEDAIEFAVEEWNPITEKVVVSIGEELVNVVGWEAKVDENH